MPTISLDGVDGNQPLGFLTAVGTLRILTDQVPQLSPRLSWDADTDRPTVHLNTDDDIQTVLLDQLDRYAHQTLNGDFPIPPTSALPPGGAGKVPTWPDWQPDPDWFEAVHHWCPWLSPSWNTDPKKNQPAFRMAPWAKNCGGNHPLPPIGVAQAAARLLTLTPRGAKADPYPAEVRWHDLLHSGLQTVEAWQDTFRQHTGKTAPAAAIGPFTSGYQMWWLAPATDPGRHGISGATFSNNPSKPSTQVKTICAPGHALLTLPGLGSIPAHSTLMPGQDRTDRTDQIMRWTLWAQPLTLNAATTLQWHPALNQPHSPAVHQLCGNHPAPVRAATLHPDSGTSPVPPPVRTRR